MFAPRTRPGHAESNCRRDQIIPIRSIGALTFYNFEPVLTLTTPQGKSAYSLQSFRSKSLWEVAASTVNSSVELTLKPLGMIWALPPLEASEGSRETASSGGRLKPVISTRYFPFGSPRSDSYFPLRISTALAGKLLSAMGINLMIPNGSNSPFSRTVPETWTRSRPSAVRLHPDGIVRQSIARQSPGKATPEIKRATEDLDMSFILVRSHEDKPAADLRAYGCSFRITSDVF